MGTFNQELPFFYVWKIFLYNLFDNSFITCSITSINIVKLKEDLIETPLGT